MNIEEARRIVIKDQRQGYSEDEATDEELIQYVLETIALEDVIEDEEAAEAYRYLIMNS